MAGARFIERIDHWVLPLDGEKVVQCRYDYAFTLILGELDPSFVVRIEEPFALEVTPDDRLEFDPEGDPSRMCGTLRLLHGTVTRSVAHKDGRLEVDFEDGALLRAPSSQHYEPWQFSGPDGLRMVPAPGGGLVVWS